MSFTLLTTSSSNRSSTLATVDFIALYVFPFVFRDLPFFIRLEARFLLLFRFDELFFLFRSSIAIFEAQFSIKTVKFLFGRFTLLGYTNLILLELIILGRRIRTILIMFDELVKNEDFDFVGARMVSNA